MPRTFKDVLIINDFAGYGRVSTQAMIPVLSHYGHHTYALPTSLVSNTLEYGRFVIHDTTEYMRQAVDVWKSLGFRFDNVTVGFLNSHEQVEIIRGIIEQYNPSFVLVDPIMAENGKLYDGMYPGVIDCNKQMAKAASVFVPNVTEACMVSGLYLDKPSLTAAELRDVAEKLLSMGPRDLVITGCEPSDRDAAFNYVYDHVTNTFHEVVYEKVPTQFIGTGDLFSGILTAECLSGSSVLHAVKVASSFISIVLQDNLDTEDHYDLHFERYMKLLNN